MADDAVDSPKARRIALVTGAAGGIGRALVEGFRSAGYEVIAVDRSTGPKAAPGRRDVTLDIRDGDAVAALGAGLDGLDCLVNAAGIIRRVEEYDLPVFEEVIDINLTGAMRLATACRAALARRRGAIVNIASVWSFFGGGLVPAYSASKGGIVTLTKSLAVAWADDGIRVNALAPGWIATPLTRAVREDENRNRAILERTPMRRWGEPADLVGPALFLAGPDARFITGAVLPVDGGYSAM